MVAIQMHLRHKQTYAALATVSGMAFQGWGFASGETGVRGATNGDGERGAHTKARRLAPIIEINADTRDDRTDQLGHS